jgi:hypothetical protein
MYKIYYYNDHNEKTYIEYGFAKYILKRISNLIDDPDIEVQFVFRIPFSFRSWRKCFTRLCFERKE